MLNEVFLFIKNIHGDAESAYSKYMGDPIFKIPTPQMLSKVVDGINGIKIEDDREKKKDIKGDLYEYLLSKVATAGTNGQFRTPRHIIDMMVKLMKPTPSDFIVDPAMGSVGFLVSAQTYLRDNHNDLFLNAGLKEHFNNKMFYSFDMDRTMLLHGVVNPGIEYKDSLSEQNEDKEKYTLVLAKPPFKGGKNEENKASFLNPYHAKFKARGEKYHYCT